MSAYQNRGYADEYRRFVGRDAESERKRLGKDGAITTAVATKLAKLMAYKDEYEVARLFSSRVFKDELNAQFDDVKRVPYHLALPTVRDVYPANGRPRKRAFGPWMGYAFALLARLRWLRGTPLDPFGYASERRMERRLIQEYRRTVVVALDQLSPETEAQVLAVMSAPDGVRGFGAVKLAAVQAYRNKLDGLMRDLLPDDRSRLAKQPPQPGMPEWAGNLGGT